MIEQEITSHIELVIYGIAWILSTVISYFLGRKSKIDDVKIMKSYGLAEKLAYALQKDFQWSHLQKSGGIEVECPRFGNYRFNFFSTRVFWSAWAILPRFSAFKASRF